jgi:hypothetical protein
LDPTRLEQESNRVTTILHIYATIHPPIILAAIFNGFVVLFAKLFGNRANGWLIKPGR